MSQRVFNTLTRAKEEFRPRDPKKVGMYVCGPTVYDMSHVGHGRVYVIFDVVRRWLETRFEVLYVQNFTDVDDKIIRRANEIGEDPIALSARFADEFNRDCADLGIRAPDIAPRVSTHIEQIGTFVNDLVDKGFAYRVPTSGGDDVYFRVRKFEKYTELSRRNLDDLCSGIRVNVDERKEDPLDFALWKSCKPGEPAWDSPFGKGRPGWHIECSAMAAEHLGESFDLHCGGKDLIFPHHTNEIAQSEARHDGAEFAKYWMHNGFVDFAGEKMSKSLGNFFTIREVTDRYCPEAVRYFLLTAHYRSPINFEVESHCPSCDASLSREEQESNLCEACKTASTDNQLRERIRFPGLEEAERRVAYLYETRRRVAAYIEINEAKPGDDLTKTFSKDGETFAPWESFAGHLDDDFNTPGAIADLNELTKIGNLLVDAREKEILGRKLKPHDRARLLTEWQERLPVMTKILNVGEYEPTEFLDGQRDKRCGVLGVDKGKVEDLLKARTEARASKDWAKADAARDALHAMGVEVRDLATGVDWTVL